MKRCTNYSLLSFLLLLLVTGIPFYTSAQLSPPGLEGAKVVSWGAIGFSQKITKRWTTSWYLGGSEQSNMGSYSTKKPAIFVLNQETMYTFNPVWSLTGAVSYRYQDLYEDKAPYAEQDPGLRKEIRYYLRLFYRIKTEHVNWAFSFRPELRKFYDQHGNAWSTPSQQRYRFKAQVNIPIKSSTSNAVILANEWLFASSEDVHHNWSSLSFAEDRLSTYVRHTFKKPALYLDLGVMHQLWKDKVNDYHYTAYMALDLIFVDPFGKLREL